VLGPSVETATVPGLGLQLFIFTAEEGEVVLHPGDAVLTELDGLAADGGAVRVQQALIDRTATQGEPEVVHGDEAELTARHIVHNLHVDF
jgi:hypothetical protein